MFDLRFREIKCANNSHFPSGVIFLPYGCPIVIYPTIKGFFLAWLLAFYEVVCVAYQSGSWFVYALFLAGCKQTNYGTDNTVIFREL